MSANPESGLATQAESPWLATPNVCCRQQTDRRTFLMATALALVGGRFDMALPWRRPAREMGRSLVGDTNELTSLSKATAWFNSPE